MSSSTRMRRSLTPSRPSARGLSCTHCSLTTLSAPSGRDGARMAVEPCHVEPHAIRVPEPGRDRRARGLGGLHWPQRAGHGAMTAGAGAPGAVGALCQGAPAQDCAQARRQAGTRSQEAPCVTSQVAGSKGTLKSLVLDNLRAHHARTNHINVLPRYAK